MHPPFRTSSPLPERPAVFAPRVAGTPILTTKAIGQNDSGRQLPFRDLSINQLPCTSLQRKGLWKTIERFPLVRRVAQEEPP